MELFIVIWLAFFLALCWFGCAEKAYHAFSDHRKIAWMYVAIMFIITVIGFNYDVVVGKIMHIG